MTNRVSDIISSREFGYEPPWMYNNELALRCSLGDVKAKKRAVLRRAKHIFDALFCGGVDCVFFEHYVFDSSAEWEEIGYYLPSRAAFAEERRIYELMREFDAFPHRTIVDVAVDRSRYDDAFVRKNRCIAEVNGMGFDAKKYIENDLFTDAPTVHFVSEANSCILSFYDDRGADIVFFSKQKYDEHFDGLREYLNAYDLELMQSRRDRKPFSE